MRHQFDPYVSRNAQGVCFNPWQGEARKVLCVCSAGCLRSPTTANVLHKEYGYNTRSAGIEPEYAIVPVSARLLMWCDEVVVMESWQAQEIESMLEQMLIEREVVCLSIPDNYAYMQEELIEDIKRSYNAATENHLEGEAQ